MSLLYNRMLHVWHFNKKNIFISLQHVNLSNDISNACCIYYNLNKQILYIECKYKIVTILHRINFCWLFAYSVCVINKIRLILIETLVSLTHILELKCIFQMQCWQKFSILVTHWEDLTRGVNAYGRFLPVYRIFDGIIIQMQMARWNLIVDDGLVRRLHAHD